MACWETQNSKLNLEDGSDLEERRRQRVSWLQSTLEAGASFQNLAYTEGIELMANLYRAGGFAEIKSFLSAVNPAKADKLGRDDGRYREAIADGAQLLPLLR